MDKLVCIITGPEHNGTTYFKKLLESHPDIYSGFETGFLLDDDFEKCVPFNKWVFDSTHHWDIPKDINLFDKNLSINDKYSILYHNKGSYQGKYQQLIRESKYLIDKTPAYFHKLPEIYKRLDNKDIPILIIIKKYRYIFNSYVVKRNMSIESFKRRITTYINAMQWLKKKIKTN